MFTRKALSIFDANNNLTQIFILLGLIVVFIVLPHGLVNLYRSTQQNRYKTVIWLGVASLIIVSFYVLGILRATYLQNLSKTSIEQVAAASTLTLKPIYFTVVQLLLLFVASYAASLLPTAEVVKGNAKAQQLSSKIGNVEQEIRKAENELNAIPDTLYRVEAGRSEDDTQMVALEARINAMYQEALGVFITENCLWRSDHSRPDCFDKPLPTLATSL
jgi:hypothetical protein